MKLLMKYMSLLLFFLCLGTISWGQNEATTIVKLKDGSVFEGKLIEFVDGEYLRLEEGNGQITIKSESIKYIKHRSAGSKKVYNFKEIGFYHQSSMGVLPGNIPPDQAVLGLELDHSSGYMFNRWIGAGLNLGMNNYDPGTREIFYSAAAETRGYFLKRNFSPFYVARVGYGFAQGGESFLVAEGGYFLNPAIGFRFGARSGLNFVTELGIHFQDAHLEQETNWWDRSIIEKDIRYQRFNLKFGILF